MLIILTSNQGATQFFPASFLRNATPEQVLRKAQDVTEQDLKNAFLQMGSAQTETKIGPEVLERLDAVLLQAPILQESAKQIAQLKVEAEIQALQQQGLPEVTVDPAFASSYVEQNYRPENGVRALERLVRAELNRIVSTHIKEFGPSGSLEIRTLPLEPGSSQIWFEISGKGNQNPLRIAGPKLAFENPLLDDELKNKLKNLEVELSKSVFGQKEYINRVASLLQSSTVNRSDPRPPSVYVTGTTGNGKSELPKALARYLYGSEEYLLTIEMGKVTDVYAMSAVFDRLEQFLKRYKRGMIHFEEMGNAGGAHPRARDEIAKTFYTMLDEGIYIDRQTKETYRLKEFFHFFSGNEALPLFAGHTQDDMLRTIWRDHSQEKQIRSLLLESGIPAAFLGRIQAAVLAEPPVSSTKVLITQKLIKQWAAALEADYPIEIRFDPEFFEQISQLTFSAEQGARSVVNFIKKTLGSQVSLTLFELDFKNYSKNAPAIVQVGLKTQAPQKPLYRNQPDSKQAALTVKITETRAPLLPRVIVERSMDFTENANFMAQIREIDAIGTAFHEAGHAVLNDPQTLGQVLEHLTVIPSDGYLGYARYKTIPGYISNYSLKTLRARLAVLVAGSEAEQLIGRAMNSGQGQDLLMARKILTLAAVKWGLVPELQGARLSQDGQVVLSATQEEIFEAFASREMTLARETAKTVLLEKWWLVLEVSRDLISKNEISGTRFDELFEKYKKWRATQDLESIARWMQKRGPQRINLLLNTLEHRQCPTIWRGLAASGH